MTAAFAALAVAGPAGARDAQPDPYESRELPLGAFERIEVSGPFKVAVLVSDEPAQIDLSGPPALLADVVAQVEGGTLTIRFREGATWSWNPGSGVNAVVSAPRLVSARARRAAQVQIFQVRGETFAAATEGAASIALLDLEAGRVQFATAGSGPITAEGSAREGIYRSAGAGSIDAKRLRVETASIAVGGAGSIYADVSAKADVSVAGSGRVDVVGGAACSKQPAASPQIECR